MLFVFDSVVDIHFNDAYFVALRHFHLLSTFDLFFRLCIQCCIVLLEILTDAFLFHL
jgi:hypothetical protein